MFLGNRDARGSPFVIAYDIPLLFLALSDQTWTISIQNAGISALPSVVNAALLTSAWSAASSDVYIASRALYGMALARNAPSMFARTTKSGASCS